MISHVVRRLLGSIPVLLVASLVVFAAMRLLPGDPVDALYPANASVSPEARAALRAELGLDEPVPLQYTRWLMHTLSGDLGTSLRQRRPVLQLIAQRAPLTGMLVLLSTVLAVAIAVPLGTLAAIGRESLIDHAASALALGGLSVPGFALGTLLALVFGVWLRIVPTVGHPALPVVTQALAAAGILVRNVRSGVLDELKQEYVRTARSKGLHELRSLVIHIAPNALPVTVSVLATVVSFELGGSVVIEEVFGWPGLGSLLFDSVAGRDFAVVQAVALLAVMSCTLVNLAADISRGVLDPRTR
ncbi:MAG: ABC transporter permease [Chloroflexi bacterium]|nr:ABC transporter permease [Chloroflexota bacterium]